MAISMQATASKQAASISPRGDCRAHTGRHGEQNLTRCVGGGKGGRLADGTPYKENREGFFAASNFCPHLYGAQKGKGTIPNVPDVPPSIGRVTSTRLKRHRAPVSARRHASALTAPTICGGTALSGGHRHAP